MKRLILFAALCLLLSPPPPAERGFALDRFGRMEGASGQETPPEPQRSLTPLPAGERYSALRPGIEGTVQAGMEELSLEEVREGAGRLRGQLLEPLETMAGWLDLLEELPEQERSEAAAEAMDHIFAAQRFFQKEVGRLPAGLFKATVMHETENPLTVILLSRPPSENPAPAFFLQHLSKMRRGLSRISAVLEELASLRQFRLTALGGTTLIELQSSQSTTPRWLEPDALPARYGRGLEGEAKRLAALAAEAQAHAVLLMPLDIREEEPLRIRPYYYGDPKEREAVERYLNEANGLLAADGIQFKPLKDPYPGALERIGLVVRSGERPLPPDIALPGYRVLPAARLRPDAPGRYDPVLVAAAALHPLLPLEVLEARVKLTLVIRDSLTGARYLAILA